MKLSARRAFGAVGAGLGLTGAAAGLLAVVNRALRLHDLPPTLPGANHDWLWRGWRVRYTTLGTGPPLVLVHGVHAAASAFEMRGIFEPLARQHTVYAVDLLGFGKSERPRTRYTSRLYVDLITDFFASVLGRPATVLATSLSAAYASEAARRRPDLVGGVILVSPTEPTGAGVLARAAGRLLGTPLVGTAAFNVLVSRVSIRRYLARAYADPSRVDDQVVEQSWATAHQPGARFAPAAFIAGDLDLPIGGSGGAISAPILVLKGETAGLGRPTPDAALLRLGPRVAVRTVPGTGLLPHDEAPERSVELIERWLDSLT